MKQSKSLGKPFEISKWAVAEAYRRVKTNKGAAGVDGQSVEKFESFWPTCSCTTRSTCG